MPQIKKWNILVYFLIFLAFSLAGKLLHLVTDYWWFQEIQFSTLFMKSLSAKVILGVLGAALAWAVLLVNWMIAKKLSDKPFVVIGPEVSITSPLPIPQLAELKPLLHTIAFVVILAAGFFIGSWSATHWETALKFLSGVPFGVNDPIFDRDIGFYIFSLPFYRFLFDYCITVLVLSMVLCTGIYFLNTRVYLTQNGIEAADYVKTHLAVLAGFLALLLMFHFHLNMFDLLAAQREVAPGAGYADLNAYLPGLKVLRFVALAAAILLWVSPWYRNAKILFGAGLLLVAGTVIARAYAGIVQKFKVDPNEIVMETPYIRLAIQHTLQAYGLSDVQKLKFDPQENLTAGDLKKNDLTIKNIRLWEHRPLLTTYSQLQEIRTYYDFLDADNDRYHIDGEYRQVMLSVRELVPESLPSRTWINEHLTYTHGYGICVGPVNQISPEGLPEFFVKDIPPESNTSSIKVTQPRVYFGESRTKYAIVNTKAKEFDYPYGEENVYTDYAGKGGVLVSSFLRRLIFAIRFGEFKILFSADITPESRFIYYRSVKERLARSAPFIRFDSDPYIVISDEGKLFWITDGYTITDRYPYSEITGGINYVRNSVKATVDAYDGTISLYIADPEDPIVRTYDRIFPGIFKPISEMPDDLRSHIRYPQTLLDMQARIYATYHMTDPQVFYNKEDLWTIPLRTAGGRSEQMQPYYTIMKLAGVGEKEEFILMIPFTPANKENMISWMAARCDAPHYGKLLVYDFPKQKLVYGPQQIESRIDQDAEISKQLTLWDQGGSRVYRGSLLVIPVDESLLYVQPLYLEASGGGLPELKRVIVAYGNSIVMEENLELSLMRIFGGSIDREGVDKAVARVSASGDLRQVARAAREHFNKAQSAARRGDWTNFGEEMKVVGRLLKNLAERTR